ERHAGITARDTAEVGDDRARGGAIAGAGALEQESAGKVAFDDYRVGRPVDRRQRVVARNQAGLDPLKQPPGPGIAIGQTDEADDVAEIRSLSDVRRADARDPGDFHRLELDSSTEGDRGENGQLVRSIDAFDIEARICFGIAKLLSLLEHFGEVAARVLHRREDIIAGSV